MGPDFLLGRSSFPFMPPATSERWPAAIDAGTLSVGRHEVDWEAGGVESGTYAYRLRAPDRMVSGVLVLAR